MRSRSRCCQSAWHASVHTARREIVGSTELVIFLAESATLLRNNAEEIVAATRPRQPCTSHGLLHSDARIRRSRPTPLCACSLFHMLQPLAQNISCEQLNSV